MELGIVRQSLGFPYGVEIMKLKQFEVEIYYSGFCTYQIEAKTEEEAIIKARERQADRNELLSNIESWKEADTVKAIGYEKY